ncbi:hypothetical protein [Actinoplanes flavus]|uniref:Ig-like domain-containing protein n=1 Tax=Actinoplanes flavus TaxID=2820290 RepID=A0ABS3ULD7_9ACTN|nr:hypothetical protein [Actinoplanes flavus]MBO3739603.1 hypothetical protein [Actinoplanes flavus]
MRMRRWSAALLGSLLIATGLPGAAHAATPAPSASPSPSISPTPSEPAPTPTPTLSPESGSTSSTGSTATPEPTRTVSCGGEIALGTPVTCDAIAGTEHHTWTFRTTVANERIHTQFHVEGDTAQARVTGDSCFPGPYFGECVIATPGVHTIDVYLYHGRGTASYALGLDSHDRPSRCTTLDAADFTVDGPARTGTLPRGSAGDCYRFTGTAGMRLEAQLTGTAATEGGTVDVRGRIENPDGEPICPIQFGDGTCTVAVDGVHTVFVADEYGGAVGYRFRLVRTDTPVGCGTLREAGFGDLADDQVATGEVEPDMFDCLVVRASAGLKRIRTEGQLDWQLSNAGGVVCSEWGGACDLAEAGTYTLWLRNDEWETHAYRVAFLNLNTDQGCAAATGTAWDQPAVRITPTSPLQAFCLPFTATPGERILSYVSGSGQAWISDRTGARICADQEYDEVDGCALPGSGPYRLVVLNDGDRELSHQIRRLSAPTGCVVVTPGSFGTGPAGAPDTNRCRLLDVPAAGRHLVRVVDARGYETSAQVYDAQGRDVCTAGGLCNFPAAGRYTLIAGSGVTETAYATVFARPTATGCVQVSDQGISGGAVRGSGTVAGETDCLELTASAGASIGLLYPAKVTGAARPDWTLINADGVDLCATNDCVLTGRAPYRILLNAPDGAATGDYAVVVQRTDRVSGCAVLPQGAIGATVGVDTAFSATRFATCWTIPADRHSTAEIIGYAPVTGHDGWASISVRDDTGKQVCGSARYASAQLLRCKFATGKAYSVVLTAAATGFQYRIHREDYSPAGARCEKASNTVLGGPALAGTLRTDDEVRCYRVTASAADKYWLGVRSTGYAARYWITDASGADRCAGYVVPCRAGGSTAYQIFVWPAVDGQQVPYRVDTWRLTSAGQPVAQCPVTGVGPLAATLSDQRTAVCVSVPVKNRSSFTVALSNTGGGTETPEPYYFTTLTDDGITSCSIAEGGRGCQVNLPYEQPSAIALFVLAPKTPNANLPFRAETTCDDGPCVPVTLEPFRSLRAPAVTGSVRVGSTVRAAVGSWDPAPASYSYQWTANGVVIAGATASSYQIPASLRGKRLGVTVTAKRADRISTRASSSAAVVGYGAAPKASAKPKINGTVKAGRTVKATVGAWSPKPTSYRYEWRVNGKLVAVTSSLKIKKSWAGKRLTLTVIAKRTGHYDGRAVSATYKIKK